MGAVILLLAASIGILGYIIAYNGRENRAVQIESTEQIRQAIYSVSVTFGGGE